MPTRRQIAHVLDDADTATATTTATVTDLTTSKARASRGKDGRQAYSGAHEDHQSVTVAARTHGARLPVLLQFPLLALLSFSISSLGYSLMSEWGKGDLAAVSKSLDTWAQVTTLAAWRITELALGWFGNCDWVDLTALSVLSHGPVLYLLAIFYPVAPTTAVTALAIDAVSTVIPFMLLRPLSKAHAGDKAVPNREIISDISIYAFTVGLAAAIYSVIVVLSMRLYLPRVFALHYEGLPSLTPAYEASYEAILPIMILFGLAARTFIFTPFATTGTSPADRELDAFDPVTASLAHTFWYNLYGYKSKTKVVASRTLVAAFVTGVNTSLQTSMTIAGVGPAGSLAYAVVWSAAAALTGMGLGLLDTE